MQNRPLEQLHETFLERLQTEAVPAFTPGPEVMDQKREYKIAMYGQHIPLYPITALSNIDFDSQDDHMLRFVVDSNYQLTLANHERPSHQFAQHREMTKEKDCIAAGYIVLSEDGSGKITKILNSCNDYSTDLSSLVWPLMILDLCQANFDDEITVTHGNDTIGVYSRVALSDFVTNLSNECSKIQNTRPLTIRDTNESATTDHIDSVTRYSRPIKGKQNERAPYPRFNFTGKRKADEVLGDENQRPESPKKFFEESAIHKANRDALQARLDKLSNVSFKPIR
ncbi:MAG: hypothetical protein NXI01_01050 [Gammaproteobacteria bacterium]|nr:hypothetical protein [Gammaproteobacteria bacterium]